MNVDDVEHDERFEQWLAKVDRYIGAAVGGMTSADLPDCCYRDWFDDGDEPHHAARRAIRLAQGKEDD